VPPPKEYDKKSSNFLTPSESHLIDPLSTALFADENDTTRHSLPCELAAETDAKTTAFARLSLAPDILHDVSRHMIRGPPEAEGRDTLRRVRGSGKVLTSTQPDNS
jgi:hypothetical protein